MKILRSIQRRSDDWVLQFINIIFLIIIFFLASSVVAVQPPRNLLPPVAEQLDMSSVPVGAVFVDQFGNFRIGSETANLATAIAATKSGEEASLLVVDKRLKAVALLDIIMAFNKAGLPAPAIMTIQETP